MKNDPLYLELTNQKFISYLPILTKLVDITEGPILELGMGFSTTVLDMMCRTTKRQIVSYENDPVWYEQKKHLASNFHKIILNDDWTKIDIGNIHWSIAFIDHKPARDRRAKALLLKDSADYILLHDANPEKHSYYGYKFIYPSFKYRYDYTKCHPWTSVLSNLVDLSFLSQKK